MEERQRYAARYFTELFGGDVHDNLRQIFVALKREVLLIFRRYLDGQEHARQQVELVARARAVHERLLVLVTSMSRLVTDEHFATLLRAENMDALPAVLLTSNQ